MSDGMDAAAGMIGTGIGLGIMGMGAGYLIKNLSSAAQVTSGTKKKKSGKRKKSSRSK
jgi:hypothetical protein